MEITADTKFTTLTYHLTELQQTHKEATGDFTLLLNSIQTACKFISSKVRKAGLANIYGNCEESNASGDVVKKLDVLANEFFIKSLKSSKQVCVVLSEEEKEAILVPGNGKYIVAIDPLDGSSNIDANVTIGSIFAIWKRVTPDSSAVLDKDLLQSGENLVAAGYCVYGSSTQFIICLDKIVNGYTLDPALGEFILTHPNLRIKETFPIYSINEGNSVYWDKAVAEYVAMKKSGTNGKVYSLRYVGSMVADVHRTLLYGGIFMYPSDSKSPKGKLRLLYECFPMSFIIENAGGKSTTGFERILSIQPNDIHQRAPIILGSKKDVTDVEELYSKHEK